MQFVVIPGSTNSSKHWQLNQGGLIVSLVVLLAVGAYASISVYRMLAPKAGTVIIQPLAAVPEFTQLESEEIKESARVEDHYAQRLGLLQAEATRLKVLMNHLATETGVDIEPLSEPPGQGGINEEGKSLTKLDFETMLGNLTATFLEQKDQIETISALTIMATQLKAAIPMGAPTKSRYISSKYGNRIHPITGKYTFHKGIDFPSPSGAAVLATADGVVVTVERRSGYGTMVELDHGNGYVTRYAHNKAAKVTVGDKVHRGDRIALVGSTGRSTGPHVHYELRRNGAVVSPHSFVKASPK